MARIKGLREITNIEATEWNLDKDCYVTRLSDPEIKKSLTDYAVEEFAVTLEEITVKKWGCYEWRISTKDGRSESIFIAII